MPSYRDPIANPPARRPDGCWPIVQLHIVLDDANGAAGTEFALLLPVLIALLMGIFDYASLAYKTMQVSSAAQAGADYALFNASGGWNATNVQTAVTSATGLTVSATPAPQLEVACVTNGALVVTAASTCPSGATPGAYAVVNAQATFTPIIAWSNYVMPSTIKAQAVVRIQ
jgi:Flp pilus assembly protein TadG